MKIKEHLKLLGLRVEDKVTGQKGVVVSVSFDLYGCIKAVVSPGIGPDGKLIESIRFDVARLTVFDETPVMLPPDFDSGEIAEGKKGPALKPSFLKP